MLNFMLLISPPNWEAFSVALWYALKVFSGLSHFMNPGLLNSVLPGSREAVSSWELSRKGLSFCRLSRFTVCIESR